MKNLLRLFSATAVVTVLSGCVIAFGDGDVRSNWRDVERKNMNSIEDLQMGAELSAVRSKLGEAQFVEAFAGKDGDYKVLFYRTQHARSDGETTRDETTPVVFRNGHLIGYGKRVYDSAVIN
jgi:hypothetical protein